MITQKELERALIIYQVLEDIGNSRLELKNKKIRVRCAQLLDKVLTVLEKAI